MLSLILIWGYALLVSGILGLAVLSPICRKTGYHLRHLDSILFAGITVLTVYSQLFSLIFKVGLAANALLVTGCTVLVLLRHRSYRETLRTLFRTIPRGKWVAWTALFFFMAYGASRGEIHYDTSLYHAQSVHWLESYGVVKGLGNLHNRLAYNSSAFSLTALFSFSFLGGQSFHAMAGFLAWMLACTCTGIADCWKRKKAEVSDFVILVAIYYLTTIYNQMISPESDYFMNIVVLFILIRWCRLIEAKDGSTTPYALLCVLGVYAVTLKLSAAMLLLLVCKPAVMLIQRRDGRGISRYLSLGIITVLPYLIRNVILSGWLVYPFPAVDLFQVDWKIPAGAARFDANEIKVYGRGLTDSTLADQPFLEWFPDWFAALSGFNMLLVALSFLTVALTLLWGMWIIFRKNRGQVDHWLVQLTCSGCFLFWLTNAPLVRYGFIFIGLCAAVLLGNGYTMLQQKFPQTMYRGFLVLLVGFTLWKTVSLGRQIKKDYVNNYWLCQKDYDNMPVESYEINGITFYYPQSGDRAGYDAFPSSDRKRDIELRGTTLQDGFRTK